MQLFELREGQVPENPLLLLRYNSYPRATHTRFVAIQDGEEAAYLAVDFSKGFIDDLYVLPEVQGKGIGTAVLRAAEALLFQRGFSEARLLAIPLDGRPYDLRAACELV